MSKIFGGQKVELKDQEDPNLTNVLNKDGKRMTIQELEQEEDIVDGPKTIQ